MDGVGSACGGWVGMDKMCRRGGVMGGWLEEVLVGRGWVVGCVWDERCEVGREGMTTDDLRSHQVLGLGEYHERDLFSTLFETSHVCFYLLAPVTAMRLK
jgi:hypothetical protein